MIGLKKIIVSALALTIMGSVSSITMPDKGIIADAASIPAIEYPTSVTESSDGKEIILKWDLTKLNNSSRTWLNKNKNNTILLNYKTYGFNPYYGDKYDGMKAATKSGNTYTVKIRANKSNDLKIKYYDSQSGKTGSSKIVCVYNKTMNDNAFSGTEIWNQAIYYNNDTDKPIRNIQVANGKVKSPTSLVLMTNEEEWNCCEREITKKTSFNSSNFKVSGNNVIVKCNLNNYIDNWYINSFANSYINKDANSGYRKNARTYLIGSWTNKYPASKNISTTIKIAKHTKGDNYINITATTGGGALTTKVNKNVWLSQVSKYMIYSGNIKVKAKGYGCSSVKTYTVPFTYIDMGTSKTIKESTKKGINLLYSINNVDYSSRKPIVYTDGTKRSIDFYMSPDPTKNPTLC